MVCPCRFNSDLYEYKSDAFTVIIRNTADGTGILFEKSDNGKPVVQGFTDSFIEMYQKDNPSKSSIFLALRPATAKLNGSVRMIGQFRPTRTILNAPLPKF